MRNRDKGRKAQHDRDHTLGKKKRTLDSTQEMHRTIDSAQY
jgi:hypothetical protein